MNGKNLTDVLVPLFDADIKRQINRYSALAILLPGPFRRPPRLLVWWWLARGLWKRLWAPKPTDAELIEKAMYWCGDSLADLRSAIEVYLPHLSHRERMQLLAANDEFRNGYPYENPLTWNAP